MNVLLNEYLLHMVLGNLTGSDLQNASHVNRIWFQVVRDINRKKRPICVIKDNSNIQSLDNVEDIRKKIILNCQLKPFFHMFVTSLGWRRERPQKCYCQYLPLNCYSISIENFWSMEDDNIVSSLFLPDVPNLKITTISFNKHILGNRLYCEELKRSFDQSFNDADQLKTLFNTVFNNSNPTKNCLILLYRTNSCSIPENLIRSFTKWFPKEKASIIVGMVKNFFICSSTKNSRVCKTNANCLSILIRGMDMETSILRFNSFYDGSKLLKKFRDGIILKTHTICIMITGECCMRNSVNRKFENFNKYFPNVPLFQIYGFETMSASSSNELHKKFYNKWEKIESTVFMIITYN